MRVLVDTCVWSLALARRTPRDEGSVLALRKLITDGEDVLLAGIVLQELLQGVRSPEQAAKLAATLEPFELVVADRADHDTAAVIYRQCRAKGLTVGSVDALIAALAIRREATLLTVDTDFEHMAPVAGLRLFPSSTQPRHPKPAHPSRR